MASPFEPDPEYQPGSILMNLVRGAAQPGPGGGALRRAPQANGGMLEQLRQGFMDAGRPDLAKMVGHDNFMTWMNQESGGDPHVVSPANNQGLPNGGLFQFWYGHDFSNPAEGRKRFKASPYQQAMWAAQNFDLTPQDIHTYANQIANGSYGGWG